MYETKFKVGDKVKIITNIFRCGSDNGIVTKVNVYATGCSIMVKLDNDIETCFNDDEIEIK